MIEYNHLFLRNGRFYGHPEADCMLIRDGRIAAIGASQLLGEPTTAHQIDLKHAVVLPGFVDAHVHLLDTGLTELGWRVDLSGLSRDATLERLQAAAGERRPGEWLVASGWDESRWTTKTYLTRAELDRIAPHSPVAAVRMDCHLVILNSPALRLAADGALAAVGGSLVDAHRGEVREEGAWAVMDLVEPSESILSDAAAAAARTCHRLGVTSVHTMSSISRVPALCSHRSARDLRITVYQKVSGLRELETVTPPSAFDETWTRFGGIKLFADGSLGAGNAALQAPYAGGGTGTLNHTDNALADLISHADAHGWQTAVHAIGDRAIEQVLRAHAVAGTRQKLRHRLEHVELITAAQLDRAAELGLCLSMQPNFIGNWSGPRGMYVERIGPDRDGRSNPLRQVCSTGILLAFGSDGMPISPLYGIASTLHAPYEVQRISLSQAVDAYTRGGALLGFAEDGIGSLAPGAPADLAVADGDLSASQDGPDRPRVRMTFLGGNMVYQEKDAV